jgi:hypothetical protein
MRVGMGLRVMVAFPIKPLCGLTKRPSVYQVYHFTGVGVGGGVGDTTSLALS